MASLPIRLSALRRRNGLLLVLLVLACPGITSVQPAADAKIIEAYRLTTAALKQVVNVNRALIQEMTSDPALTASLALSAEIEALSRKDELTEAEAKQLEALEARMERLEDDANPLSGDASSLDEMEARIRKFPPLMRALTREGMEPREYATFWMAFMQAAFVHGFQKSGMLKDPPPGVNMENVRFIAEHTAEIEAMQKELEALGRAP